MNEVQDEINSTMAEITKDTTRTIGLLVEGIKTQQVLIDVLFRRVEKLENRKTDHSHWWK